MNLSDLKLAVINTIALIISTTNIEEVLQITLLLASIIYTLLKIVDLWKKR